MIYATIKKFADADRQTDGKTHRHRSSNSSLDRALNLFLHALGRISPYMSITIVTTAGRNRVDIQSRRKSTIIYYLKMEHGWFIWLKVSLLMYTYTTKNIFESLSCRSHFQTLDLIYFIKWTKMTNSVTKMTIFPLEWISKMFL